MPLPRANILEEHAIETQTNVRCHDAGHGRDGHECSILIGPQRAGDEQKVHSLQTQPDHLTEAQVRGVLRQRALHPIRRPQFSEAVTGCGSG